jgi:CHAT domain-containing protein/tetratricopeptide (TPR) repeat protein
LANVYRERIRGDRAENIEQAIRYCTAALSVYTPQAFPQDWAQTQNNLANVYRERIRGDRAENIEQAIRYCTAALSVYTPQAFPQDWAQTQNNLANVYRERIRGDRAENIEQAIRYCTAALSVYTPQAFPQDWARTQNNLANVYRDRIRGDRAENIEQAIRYYAAALSVYTPQAFPQDWAMTQNNLGLAYTDRIRGDSAENIEQAIRYCTAALSVYTREAFPQNWAMTQNNLGVAYRDRIRGDRAENIEQAIRYYTAALEVRTREAFPQDWARTQNNLVVVYRERIKGDRAENLEQAIRYCTAALEFYTPQAFPQDWARTQNNLANVYRERIKGDRAENLEQAIRRFTAALKIRTRPAFPQDWAITQNNLGTAYSQRIREDRAENLEQAIRCFTAALKIRTRQDFPQDWAMTQNNLANAYDYRIRGDRAQNIESAIRYCTAALSVYTREAFPQYWAMTQHNLANAYSQRIRGDRAENIEQAIRRFTAALEVLTREALPQSHAATLFNLGLTYRKFPNLQLARNTFADAIDTVEFLRGEIYSGDESKQKLAEEWNKLYQNMVEVCLELKNYTAAIEYVERSKARNLVELLATRDLYPKGEIPQAVRTEVQRLRQEIQVEKRRLAVDSTPDYTLVNQLRQRYNELYPFEPIEFDQIQNLIGDGTAIIQWYIFGDCFRAFIITRHHPQPLVWRSSAEDLEKLVHWSNDYLGAYYASRQAEITAAEREELEKQWQDSLANRLQKLAEILHITDILNTLRKIPATFDQLILVPHLFLHLFPIHALPVSERIWQQFNSETQPPQPINPCLLDCFKQGVRYTPSCQLLQRVEQQQRPHFHRLFGIQTPTEDLYEADLGAFGAIKKQFAKADLLKQAQAKKSQLLRFDENTQKVTQHEGLLEAHYAFFFCHGYFDLNSPLDSHLQLADENLTLADIINHFDMKNCRLVSLSACETGLTDFRKASDEYIGLPSGFLLAGSTNVVSTLWYVSAKSTALFMIKFHEELQHNKNIAVALNTTQLWLRDTTLKGFREWLKHSQLNEVCQQELDKYFATREEHQGETAKIFESPYYWAAFCVIGKGVH